MKTKILGLLAVGLLAGPMAAHAALISYDTEAAFLAAVSNPGVDTFDDLSTQVLIASPINRTAGSYSYTAATTSSGFVPGGTAGGDVWLSTNIAGDSIVFNNFGGGANAIGGFFFTSDIEGLFSAGDIQILVVDSSGSFSTTLVSTTTSTFLGFVSSDSTLASLTVSSVQPTVGVRWPTVNDLTLATTTPTVPEPGTLALLGLGLAGLGLSRRRRAN